jgi:uncharacterized protein
MPELLLKKIALFPLTNGLMPESVLHLNIFEVRYLHLMKECHKTGTSFGIVSLARGAEVRVAGQVESFYPWGTLASIREFEQVQPSLYQLRVTGGFRFHIESSELGPLGIWYAQVSYLEADPPTEIPKDLNALADRLGQLIATAQQQGFESRLPCEPPYKLDDAGWVANRWLDLLVVPPEAKANLLAELNPITRLKAVMDLTHPK